MNSSRFISQISNSNANIPWILTSSDNNNIVFQSKTHLLCQLMTNASFCLDC